jgi:hypothetical protein
MHLGHRRSRTRSTRRPWVGFLPGFAALPPFAFGHWANGADVADAIDGIRTVLESRRAELEKSAQRGRLAQQH